MKTKFETYLGITEDSEKKYLDHLRKAVKKDIRYSSLLVLVMQIDCGTAKKLYSFDELVDQWNYRVNQLFDNGLEPKYSDKKLYEGFLKIKDEFKAEDLEVF